MEDNVLYPNNVIGGNGTFGPFTGRSSMWNDLFWPIFHATPACRLIYLQQFIL